jgi:hypothetical protein
MASLSALDDQVVSRASIILEKQSDWKLWYSMKKQFATVKGVWEYCDPSTTKQPPSIDDEPLDTASDSAWRRWEIKTNAQRSTLKAIGEVNLEIMRTVARSKLHLIADLDLDVRLRLKTLQDHFRITNQQQILELSSQYAAIQQKRKNQNVDTWLNEYSRITSLCQSEDMAEMKGTRPQWAFIQAVEAQGDADWSNQHFTLMIGCEEDDKTPPTLEALINRYRRWIATKRTHTKSLGSFAAKDGTQATLAITNARPNNRPRCVCGLYHNYLNCYTLNPTAEGRPGGYRLSQTAIRMVQDAFKDRELLKKIKKLYKDNNVRWTFDTAQNPDRSENRSEIRAENRADIPASATPGRRPHADRIDDDDSTGDYYANTAFHMAQIATPKGDTLLDRWIVDPGSNVHICNSTYFNWRKTSDARPTEVIFAGATGYQVAAWGEVIVSVNRGNQKKDILLTHVAYVPGFLTNLFALGRCRRSGIHFDSGRNILYKERISNVVANLAYSQGHWLLDAKEADRPPRHELLSMAARSSQEKSPQTVTAMRAHQLLGHPSYQALEHLQDATTGLKIGTNGRGDPWTDDCIPCIQGKMKEDISRRPRTDKACRPFYRISIDIIQLQERGEVCYNGDVWALHAVCEYTKLHEICTLRNRHKTTVVPAIIRLVNKIERVYGYQVAIVFMDGDVGYGRAEANLGSSAQEELASAGIKVEMRSPDTPAQLGGAERAGAVIVTVARVIRIHAGLPKALANELICTAVRLLNVTPTKALGWRTPQEMVTGIRPDLSRLHVIGSRGFLLNKHLLKGDKLEKRTFEGFLIGYDASNIYRVWLPHSNRVIRVRDVRFIDELYKEKPSTPPVEPRIIETVHIPEEEYDGDTIVVAQPIRQRQEATTAPVSPPTHVSEKEYDGDTIAVYQRPVRQLLSPSPTPTPTFEGHDRSSSPDPVEQQLLQESSALMDPPHRTPGGWNDYENDDAEIYIPDRQQNNAPQRRDPNLSQDNIVTGRRRRQAHFLEAAPALSKYFAFAATIAQAKEATSTASQLRTNHDPTRIHRDDLPPPPRHWKELNRHAHKKQFEAAAVAEFDSCWKKGTFANPDITADRTDAVPLMWVFTYKFDEDGYLLKHKARLVVRGDLQEQYGDTYAATLAARLFRALMALACAFNLKAMQYDVPNAFLNATLDRTLHVRTPDGFQDKYGQILRLLRALYGLKEAPRLWALHFQDSLRKLGLHPIQGFPCLWMNDRVILFFYVDDIIILYHPDYQEDFEKLEQQLIKLYSLRQMGNVKWFLGIRVERVLASRQLYLSQDSFIVKVCTEFNLIRTDGKYPSTPLSSVSRLLPYDGVSEPSNTKTYQRLVGNLAYIEIMTRPDVAHAHSILARFLINPGPVHLSEIKHVWQYLYGTRYLAISARGGEPTQTFATKVNSSLPTFFGASDASFGDDVETRRSSAGYVFILYGMPIDWKATVLRSVTRSTTEAELYALSAAGIESQYWDRFCRNIGFTLLTKKALWCDNAQTVRLVEGNADRIQTKLRHVDIHQMWLRQEVEAGRITVEWKSTTEMPADGFTKLLPRQKHENFVRQLGMKDIRHLIVKDLPCPVPSPMT